MAFGVRSRWAVRHAAGVPIAFPILYGHITFAPCRSNTMFGAPAGDFYHGLLPPDLMGPNRPGPKGFLDYPIPIEGLYLGSAGYHGPDITFTPGYNAAHQALSEMA